MKIIVADPWGFDWDPIEESKQNRSACLSFREMPSKDELSEHLNQLFGTKDGWEIEWHGDGWGIHDCPVGDAVLRGAVDHTELMLIQVD